MYRRSRSWSDGSGAPSTAMAFSIHAPVLPPAEGERWETSSSRESMWGLTPSERHSSPNDNWRNCAPGRRGAEPACPPPRSGPRQRPGRHQRRAVLAVDVRSDAPARAALASDPSVPRRALYPAELRTRRAAGDNGAVRPTRGAGEAADGGIAHRALRRPLKPPAHLGAVADRSLHARDTTNRRRSAIGLYGFYPGERLGDKRRAGAPWPS